MAINSSSVPSSESEPDEEQWKMESMHADAVRKNMTNAGRNIKGKTLIWLVKELLLLGLAIQGLWYIYNPQPAEQQQQQYNIAASNGDVRSCNCGASVAEAISRGCKYDSLAAGWLPEHCRDDELTAEFERAGDGPDGSWIYWVDRNHTQEIPLEELATKGDDPDFRFHMSIEWHKVHCIYYWRKEHRARFNGKKVERRSDSEPHINHCGMILSGMAGPGTVAGVELNMDQVEEE